MTFYQIVVIIIRFVIRVFNGKPHIEGLEHLNEDTTYIIAGTHRSLTDPFFVAAAVKSKPVAFMAKVSVFKFKPIAYILKKGYVFPVNRDKPSATSIKHAVKVLNETGYHLGIFPSGTRYSTEIKSGTAFIQKLSKKAIVPVAIQPPIGFWQFITRRRAKIAFGAPIPFDEAVKYDKEKLAEVDALIAKRFDQLDKQLDANYVYIPKVKKEKKN
ncbi:1-acyl-sn-glycerol-3-phosphate acyltransferase [Aerococcaceae bacterium NML210727]|nr:1-acyl-sn-glycerol-3-phosphate acyltransferase [Aerococcaceae bacterium NML210727]MCW6654124.1 1-acyl-sn-glycerol-3-phosphate acyltransferase [Aerococcaceae bacterium NML201296]MCW6666397.1 1-acyl-sn-glycerol-3-phosphate acyltransferase [Aerococcaceae bacterium NML190938]